MERVGILGGSFDPVHWGHLVIGEEARIRMNLTLFLFIPAGQQRLKGRKLSPANHRLEMLKLALVSNPLFELSRTEIDRPGPSYTADTLEMLGRQYKEAELYFILGGDSLAELPTWHEPQRLIQQCYLVAVPRLGLNPPNIRTLEKALPGLGARVIFLEAPVIGISSTMVRERVKQGLSIRYLVPEAVEKYIWEQGLYR